MGQYQKKTPLVVLGFLCWAIGASVASLVTLGPDVTRPEHLIWWLGTGIQLVGCVLIVYCGARRLAMVSQNSVRLRRRSGAVESMVSPRRPAWRFANSDSDTVVVNA